jgi:NAD(P)H dehydrogenase (quinone)
MKGRTIAVTGASGGVGSRVVRELVARVRSPVLALARRPDTVPLPGHARARLADYDLPETLREAFSGVETLVFVSSDGVVEKMRRHHEHVVGAAVDAGVEHVVYMSILDTAPDSRFYYAGVHRDTERLLEESGLRRCFARTSVFADFFVTTWLEPAFASGVLSLPAGAGRMSLQTRDDAAAALAVAAASAREGIITLTGPEALGVADVCRLTEAAAGRRLRYRAVVEATYRAQLAAEGAPAWLIEAYASMFASVVEGRFAAVSADLPQLIDRPPQAFAQFVAGALRPVAEPLGT